MVFVVAIVSVVAGGCVGFIAAAFIAGRSTPCPWCDERDRQAPYKIEIPEGTDVLIREALRQ